MPLAIFAIAAAAGAVEGPSSGPAYLVRNIGDGADLDDSSEARGFAAVGDLVFFTANDGVHGRELWRTDGTPAGTQLVRDIVAGPGDGFPWWTAPVAFGDLVAFVADDGTLWRSDGSAEGTFAILDRGADSMVGYGDVLFFTVADWSDINLALELWRSDGTPEGTMPIRRFAASAPGSGDCWEARALTVAGDRLYATGSSGSDCTQIWGADLNELLNANTLESALPIELPLDTSLNERLSLASAGNILLLVAADVDGSVELWRSDGTVAGSFALLSGSQATPLFYYDADWQPHFLSDGDRAYFIANDGVHGLEPWVTDGTRDGTRLYADVVGGPKGLLPCPDDSSYECELSEGIQNPQVNLLPRANGLLIARSYYNPPEGNHADLWESDGGAGGARRIEDPVPAALLSQPRNAAGRSSSVLFGGGEGEERGMWFGDGTLAGSRRVAAVDGANVYEAASGFIFLGWDERGYAGEPWWSDGTPGGTYLLRDLRPGDASSTPRDLTDLKDVLLFSAADTAHGRELWRSDGSEAGTELVADIHPGAAGSEPAEIVRFGDAVLFTADDGTHGAELWRSDGSGGGTLLVSDIRPGAASARPHRLTVVDGALYFYADDGEHGIELWTSDGSAAGTLLVADVNPQGDACEYADDGVCYFWGGRRDIAGAGGAVYFVAYDGVHGTELWRSDGPGRGAELVADIGAGADSTWPHDLLEFDGSIYFNAAWDPVTRSDEALWRTGGAAATGPLRIPPLRLNSHAHVIDGELVALASDLADGLALWRLDASGRQTATLVPFYASERYRAPVGAGGSIFFAGVAELWRSDVGVLDTYDYTSSQDDFASLTNVAGKLLFAARDHWSDSITELWTADGLRWGTRRLQSLPPTEHSYSAWSEPGDRAFVVAGERVFFAADSGGTGMELWALPLDALPEVQPIPSPTATTPPDETATPTPTASAEATPTPPPACPLDGDPPGCARLEVRDVSAAPGDTATVSVALRARGEAVAGVQVDLRFDARLRVARNAKGAPLCAVNETIRKEATVFAFTPPTCGDNGGTCSVVRAFVLSVANLDAIADGATLFTCRVEIPADTARGDYLVAASAVSASTADGVGFAIGTRDGTVHVVAEAERSQESASPASGSCSVESRPTTDLPVAAAGLLAIALLHRRRPRHAAQ